LRKLFFVIIGLNEIIFVTSHWAVDETFRLMGERKPGNDSPGLQPGNDSPGLLKPEAA
jgi:hypothetical protein